MKLQGQEPTQNTGKSITALGTKCFGVTTRAMVLLANIFNNVYHNAKLMFEIAGLFWVLK